MFQVRLGILSGRSRAWCGIPSYEEGLTPLPWQEEITHAEVVVRIAHRSPGGRIIDDLRWVGVVIYLPAYASSGLTRSLTDLRCPPPTVGEMACTAVEHRVLEP